MEGHMKIHYIKKDNYLKNIIYLLFIFICISSFIFIIIDILLPKAIALNDIPVSNSLFGKGNDENPYLIYNAGDFGYLIKTENTKNNNYSNAYCYKLMNDLDLSIYQFDIINNFNGTLDGNNFTITLPSRNEAVINLLKGTIKNINFLEVNINFNVNSSGGSSYSFGSIVNKVDSNGAILNVKVQGKLKLTFQFATNNIYIGGVAGYGEDSSKISNVFNLVSIEVYLNTNYSGALNLYVGGVIGYKNGSITNCVNESKLSSYTPTTKIKATTYKYVGGIAGYCSSTIKECYNTSSILSGNKTCNISYAGGIVGYCQGKIIACYNLGNITSQAKETILNAGKINISDEERTRTEDMIDMSMYGTPADAKWWDTYKNEYYTFKLMPYVYNSSSGLIESINSTEDIYTIYRKNYITKYYCQTEAYSGGIVGYSNFSSVDCFSKGTITGGSKYYKYEREISFYVRSQGFSYTAEQYQNISDIPGKNFKVEEAKYSYYTISTFCYGSINGNIKSKNYNCCMSTSLKSQNEIYLDDIYFDSITVNGLNTITEFGIVEENDKFYLAPSSKHYKGINISGYGLYEDTIMFLKDVNFDTILKPNYVPKYEINAKICTPSSGYYKNQTIYSYLLYNDNMDFENIDYLCILDMNAFSTINRDRDTNTYSSISINNLNDEFYAQNNDINNGEIFLKCFYWEYV